MMITIVFVLFALVAAVFFALVARKRAPGNISYSGLLDQLEPIDVPSLLNLIDTREIEFLRTNLDSGTIGRLERKRNRALIVYVRRILHNTEILMMCGDAASRSEVKEIATAGADLLNLAMRTRMRSLSTLGLLYGAIVFPSLSAGVPQTVAGYRDIRQHSDNLLSLFSR
jgi:hypothetical protein